MRVVVDAGLSCRDADRLQQFQCSGAGRRGVDREMGPNGLGQLCTNGEHWVQRCQGILENGADLFAPHPAHGLMGQVVDALPIHSDLARSDTPRRVKQSNNGCTSQ